MFSLDVKVTNGGTISAAQVGEIVEEQWPGSMLYEDFDRGYNYLITSASC